MKKIATQPNNIRKYVFANAYYDESNQKKVLEKHHHTENEMVFVKEGKCVFDISGEKYTIKKNQLLLISELENHSTEIISTPYHRYIFMSSMELSSAYTNDPLLKSAFIRCQRQGPIDLTDELAEEIEKRFEVLVNETEMKKDKWKERCSLIQYDILILIYRHCPYLFINENTNKSLDIILSIKEYIDQHYYEDISLDSISQQFFINKYYLSHQFKEMMGYGFKKYLQLVRINNAKILLKTTDLSIHEICTAIGYDNTNYFIRLFKEREEITPYQYRKMFSLNKPLH